MLIFLGGLTLIGELVLFALSLRANHDQSRFI